jgi:hypothetical protein
VVTSRRRLTLFIVALLIAVIQTAYASPPDPSWIAGYWDDDDFDYTVVSITGSCAIDVRDATLGEPILVAVARLEPVDPTGCPSPLVADVHPRGPPPRLFPANA